MQFQLGERDIEIDRMKTTLFALNEKLAMVTDIKNDLEETKSYLQGSEQTRQELQGHIQETSQRVKKDASDHDSSHQKKISEIQSLNDKI